MSTNFESARSVCVFCGSSNDADPGLLADAGRFGRYLADARLRLVYGGGGVGLMGACARGAFEAGGEVLGIIPAFLTGRELPLEGVETVVVETMHERKIMMFNQSDAFVVLPGGIGTLEEVVELLSWRRLELHLKPVVFYSPDGFWAPLIDLFEHTISAKLTPESFRDCYSVVNRCEDILPAILGS
jgi:uncharacterized protein (TIGR00730 family)